MSQIIVDSETNLSLTNKLVADDTFINNISGDVEVGNLTATGAINCVDLTASDTINCAILTTPDLQVGNGNPLHQILFGTGTVTFTNASQYNQATAQITFSHPFSSTPVVSLVNASGSSANSSVIFSASGISTTGFTVNAMYLYVSSGYTQTLTFNWSARA